MLLKILHQILKRRQKLGRKIIRFRSKIYCTRASLDAWLSGGKFIYSNIRINVPVRLNDSSGCVEVKGGSFGYPPAPLSGDGRILLQARAPNSFIMIGKNAALSNNIYIIARSRIEIGDQFLCGDNVRIMDSDFHEINPEMRHQGAGKTTPIKIMDNVWVGSSVLILKGVTIGSHSVIASGSVVTKDVPPRVVVGGVPARVIKHI